MITEKTKRLIDKYAAIRFRRSKDVPLDVRDPLQPGKYFFGYEVTAKSIEKAEGKSDRILQLASKSLNTSWRTFLLRNGWQDSEVPTLHDIRTTKCTHLCEENFNDIQV